MMKVKNGFTLTEVLIVVVILGVLASLVLPRFIRQDERAIVAEAVLMLSAIRQAEESYSLEQAGPEYTENLGLLDVEAPAAAQFNYSIAVGAGPTFIATATRLPSEGACSSEHFGNCTITLSNTGLWDGDHPFRPTSA